MSPRPAFAMSCVDPGVPGRGAALLLVVALHAALLGLLWWPADTPVPVLVAPQQVMVASLMQPEAQPVAPLEPLPAKPKPVARQTSAPPVLAVRQPVPAAEAPTIAEPAEWPVDAPLESRSAGAVTSEPVVSEPPPVVPPRFDADYLDNPAPPYPPLSRRLREQGTVLLRVYVAPGGAADRLEVKQSSGHQRLDDIALDTVRRWRFVPARQGDSAVAGWVVVPISFKLRT